MSPSRAASISVVDLAATVVIALIFIALVSLIREPRRREFNAIPFEAIGIGRGADFEEIEDNWAKLYGLDADGAVLVRPDGHVAWRSRGGAAAPDTIMLTALRAVLYRLARRVAIGQ